MSFCIDDNTRAYITSSNSYWLAYLLNKAVGCQHGEINSFVFFPSSPSSLHLFLSLSISFYLVMFHSPLYMHLSFSPSFFLCCTVGATFSLSRSLSIAINYCSVVSTSMNISGSVIKTIYISWPPYLVTFLVIRLFLCLTVSH